MIKMNLDETQKANLLAETLQKNGIACSSSEAVDKANKIIHVTEGESTAEEDKLQLLEKKYKFLLEQNNDRLLNEINSLKKSTSSLVVELNLIKSQIRQQGEKIRNQESNQPVEKEVQKKIEDTKEIKKESHPKQGSFQPEDVSIEKIFYFGEK